jgi:DNA-binding transcriptional LysR family regulator
MTEWDDYRLFLRVMKARSLAAAATLTRLDKSTLSRRLVRLEGELKTPLFVRTRDGLLPTAAALQLAEKLAPVEAILSGVDRSSLTPADRLSGVVRLAVTEALAPFVVETCVLPLSERHPDIVLEVLSGNRALDLMKNEAELALRVVEPTQASLRRVKLGDIAVGIFASPAYLNRRGRPATTRALSGHDVLLPSGELSMLPEARWLQARPRTRVTLQSNSLPALVQAAVLGRGLVAISDPWGRREERLERVMSVPGIPRRPFWLVLRPDRADEPAVRAVAETISARLRAALA